MLHSKRYRKIHGVLSLVLAFLFLIPMLAKADEDNAYQHLTDVMDKYHRTFDVYTDMDAGGNNFTCKRRLKSAEGGVPKWRRPCLIYLLT